MSKYKIIIKLLEQKNINFKQGLTEKELTDIMKIYDIQFPLSLKEFYTEALPVSERFPVWNDYSDNNIKQIKALISQPIKGVLFDVENNNFWLKQWGDKPLDLITAKNVCIALIQKAPKLIPIFSHRYMPQINGIENPPVISIVQTDIIYYGYDLEEYLLNEFTRKYIITQHDDFPPIPIWSDIINFYK